MFRVVVIFVALVSGPLVIRAGGDLVVLGARGDPEADFCVHGGEFFGKIGDALGEKLRVELPNAVVVGPTGGVEAEAVETDAVGV